MNYIWYDLLDYAAGLSEDLQRFYRDYEKTILRYFEHLSKVCIPIHDFNGTIFSLLARLKSRGKSLGLIPAGKITRDILPLCSEQDIAHIHIYDNNADKIGSLNHFPVLLPEKAILAVDEKIVITSSPFHNEIYSQLLLLGITEEKIVSYNKIAELCPIDYKKCEEINATFMHANKKRMVFINISFPWANIDRVRLLRRHHPEYSLILLTNQDFMFNGPRVESEVDGLFDHRVCMNLYTLLYMASLLSEEDILMTSGFPFCNIAILLINSLTKANHIHEIYDLCDELVYVNEYPRYHHHKLVMKDVGNEIWETDNIAKEILFSRLDKILYRDDPKEFCFLKKHYGIATPSFHMLPLHANRALPGVDKLEGIHIVHCGHIVLPMDDDEVWTDCGVQDSLYRIVPEVVSQKIHFHLLNPSDRDGVMASRFFEALDETDDAYVHYHKPAYDSKLIETLSMYTFGWMVYDFSRYSAVQMPSHYHTLSTKLFTYIQAGLPVFISKEYKYMVEICNEYSIGVVISRSDVPRIGEILRSVDVSNLRLNVLRARENLDISKRFKRYFDFITS